MAKKNRIRFGRLVASTNPLRAIEAKRLDIQVKFRIGLPNEILSTKVIGIRQDLNLA